MTLNIEIGDYRLKSDSLQIIVQRKHTVDPTKSPAFKPGMDAKIRTEWRDWKYAGKPEQALDIIARQKILESDATSLAQLRSEIVAFRREISALLAG